MMTARFAASLPAAVGSALLFGVGAAASDLHDQVDRYRRSAEPAVVRELAEFVALPNVASDLPNIQRNVDHLIGMLRARGVESRLLENPGAPPAVYGELRSPGAHRTIVFYAHYDGQPVDAAQWKTPPWSPVLRDKPLDQGGREIPLPAAGQAVPEEARLYGRSASDDKAPIVAMLTALDALKAAQVAPSINLKFYFEGEEEAESTHLKASLERNRNLLKADAWIFCDGPVHQSRRMEVVYGARGVLPLELTVYGPTRALHDGHYGNWAPNPAVLLTTLLAGMRDPDGHVAVAERIMLPALNLRGLAAGHVGAQAANAIPTEARASIDIRLVPDQKPETVRAVVERHLAAQGYFIVPDEPDLATRLAHPRIVRVEWKAGYPGVRIAMDQPFAVAVGAVVAEGLGAPVVNLPIWEAACRSSRCRRCWGHRWSSCPSSTHDNNQHAANENLRLRNLWDGIQVFAALFARLGPAWKSPGPP